MLINSEGQQEKLACFERDDKTDAYHSCSINWQNQSHIFGGIHQKRQIDKLNGYKLERIGDLPFDHGSEACSVMNNQFIYLCFSFDLFDAFKRCRRSTGSWKTFEKITLSNHDHQKARTSCSDSKSLISHQLQNK